MGLPQGFALNIQSCIEITSIEGSASRDESLSHRRIGGESLAVQRQRDSAILNQMAELAGQHRTASVGAGPLGWDRCGPVSDPCTDAAACSVRGVHAPLLVHAHAHRQHRGQPRLHRLAGRDLYFLAARG